MSFFYHWSIDVKSVLSFQKWPLGAELKLKMWKMEGLQICTFTSMGCWAKMPFSGFWKKWVISRITSQNVQKLQNSLFLPHKYQVSITRNYHKMSNISVKILIIFTAQWKIKLSGRNRTIFTRFPISLLSPQISPSVKWPLSDCVWPSSDHWVTIEWSSSDLQGTVELMVTQSMDTSGACDCQVTIDRVTRWSLEGHSTVT